MFLSLKWKATTLTLIVLLALCSFLVLLNSHQLSTLADQQQRENFKKLSDNLSGLLIQSYHHNLLLIDLLPALTSDSTTSDMAQLINHNWSNLQFNWGLESATLYNARGINIWQSDTGKLSSNLTKNALKQNTPHWHIDCAQTCRQVIFSPLLDSQGIPHYIRLEVSMADRLIDFSRISNADIGILVPQQEQQQPMVMTLGLWQQTVKLLTNPEQSSPILSMLEQRYDLKPSLHQNRIIDSRQRSYNINMTTVEHDKNQVIFIIIVDISTSTDFMTQANWEHIIVAISGVAICCAMLLSLLWSPINRLHQQAEILPMLSNNNFDIALEKLRQNRSSHWIRDEIDILNDTEEAVCQQLTNMRADIDKKSVKLHSMAMFDSLTGLSNRRAFMQLINESLTQSQLNNTPFSLLFIDLDNFKRVNDSMGHNAGDELLKIVAQRLKSCLRSSDIIARLGGDEFCIIIHSLMDKEGNQKNNSHIVAKHILESLVVPLKLRTTELIISASIGIVTAPKDGSSCEELLQNADVAMYKAKALGRNKYQYFDPSMTQQAVERLTMEGELRQGLKNEEFVLHYQPQLDLSTHQIIGFETLVRWQHPEKGLLYPDTFIHLLEETGLIVPLGAWIINESCRQLRQWLDLGVDPIRLAINISPRQLHDNDLVDQIENGIRNNQLKPKWLELEITESMIMENIELTKLQLTKVQSLGVSIAIDDFGTGHSSLSYLKSLPLDILKIDRSFVKDLSSINDDGEIVSAIIAMAHKLKLKVVAEGIETEEHQQFLARNCCDFGQGYLFSRPINASNALMFLQQSSDIDAPIEVL